MVSISYYTDISAVKQTFTCNLVKLLILLPMHLSSGCTQTSPHYKNGDRYYRIRS